MNSHNSELDLSAIAKLAFLLAPGRLNQLRAWLGEFVPANLSATIAYEIILQSYLFFGYAQAIEAAKVFAELKLYDSMKERLLERPARDVLQQRGEELCSKIYAPNFQRLVENMRSTSAELAEWMVLEGYGKVLSRPGPGEVAREVASVVFLVRSGHPVQLYSHVRGARNLGIKRDALSSVLSDLEFSGDERKLLNATIEKVFAE